MENSAYTPGAMILAATLVFSGGALAQGGPAQKAAPGKSGAPAPAVTAMAASKAPASSPAASAAAPAAPEPDNHVVDELTRISTENALLKARLKQLEIQVQIANAQAQLDKARGEESHPRGGGAHAPLVTAIDGIGANLYAGITPCGGNPTEVKTGDALSDGTKVLAITQKDVLFQLPDKRKERVGIDRSAALKAGDCVDSGAKPVAAGMAKPGSLDALATSPYMPSFPDIPLAPRVARK